MLRISRAHAALPIPPRAPPSGGVHRWPRARRVLGQPGAPSAAVSKVVFATHVHPADGLARSAAATPLLVGKGAGPAAGRRGDRRRRGGEAVLRAVKSALTTSMPSWNTQPCCLRVINGVASATPLSLFSLFSLFSLLSLVSSLPLPNPYSPPVAWIHSHEWPQSSPRAARVGRSHHQRAGSTQTLP